MRSFFEPAQAPPWVKQILGSIRAALGDIWDVPVRLFQVATADRPDATLFGSGLIFDTTLSRVAVSDGSAWYTLMPYTAGAALTRTNDTNVTLTLGGSPSSALLAATSLTMGWTGQLSAARGGTGIGSYAVGDLIYASATTPTLSKLAAVATGNALISGGTNTAPSWGKIGLTTHISGTLAVGNGGTGVTSSTGSGNVVLSVSPTFTGTITAAAITATSVSIVDAAYQIYVSGSSAILQFDGSADAFLYNRTTNVLSFFIGGSSVFSLSATAHNVGSGVAYQVNGTQVVTARQTGWGAATGTATRTAIATYASPTISSPPTQAEVQAIADALQAWSRRGKALSDDLATHGLIGA